MTPEERANAFNEATNQGAKLLAADKLDAALEQFQRAHNLLPDNPMGLYSLGNVEDEVSLSKGGPLVGEQRYRASLACRNTPEALVNMARIYDLQDGDHELARTLYKQAVIHCGYFRGAFNYGMCLLMCACQRNDPELWQEAWQWYEHRDAMMALKFNPGLWRGEALKGKHLLVLLDQGIGDRLWALRWVKRAKEEGAHVTVLVKRDMKRLCDLQLYIDRVSCVEDNESLPYDYISAGMSMAGWMDGTARLRTEPAYVACGGGLRPASSDGKLRVGLAWSCSVKRGYPAWRNVPFELLQRHLPNANVEFVSLQKGVGEVEPLVADQLPLNWHPIQQCDDVLDTAHLIRSCDLVITVSTMVAALAPSLGVETWLMNRFASDWQWGPVDKGSTNRFGLPEGYDPQWWNRVTQFRQPEPGAWEPVLQAVAAALHERVGRTCLMSA